MSSCTLACLQGLLPAVLPQLPRSQPPLLRRRFYLPHARRHARRNLRFLPRSPAPAHIFQLDSPPRPAARALSTRAKAHLTPTHLPAAPTGGTASACRPAPRSYADMCWSRLMTTRQMAHANPRRQQRRRLWPRHVQRRHLSHSSQAHRRRHRHLDHSLPTGGVAREGSRTMALHRLSMLVCMHANS